MKCFPPLNFKPTRKPVTRVWGLASGQGRTIAAARGAFTHRDYPRDRPIPKRDWLEILIKEPLAQ